MMDASSVAFGGRNTPLTFLSEAKMNNGFQGKAVGKRNLEANAGIR